MEKQELMLLPVPKVVELDVMGHLNLRTQLMVEVGSPELKPLQDIITRDKFLLLGPDAQVAAPITLQLSLAATDPAEPAEAFRAAQYELIVTGESIQIKGGSYEAVLNGLVTMWQATEEDGRIPLMTIRDHPDYPYRSLMLDVARAYYNIETLKQAIDLCRWYKLNYLHLHLTDDSAFTFPSTAFPELVTEGHRYTLAELAALNEYAHERGVILVPELDVPGHASPFIREMPELFGIAKTSDNPYTLSMGREDTYAALNILIGEIAAAFPHSPYIHIGGDEAFFVGMENDPATQSYMAEHELPNVHELFRHFLVRLNDMVRERDKQTIVWAGFGEHGELEIPKDVIVMQWNAVYHHPKALLAEGRPIINASFKPMYVVNNRKWSGRHIYEQWTPNRWESWAVDEDEFNGIELPENDAVMGATMCIWEQRQTNMTNRLTGRLPAMGTRLWDKKSKLEWANMQARLNMKSGQFDRLSYPFIVIWIGFTYPDNLEGNFDDHRWFQEELTVQAQLRHEGLTLEYATEEEPKEDDWFTSDEQLDFYETVHLRIRAKNKQGEQVGRIFYQVLFHRPIVAEADGLEKNLAAGSWEKLRFMDTLTLKLDAVSKGQQLHYTRDGSRVTGKSPVYEEPLRITSTTTVRAQLLDEKGEAFGSGFRETYYKLVLEPSLTTGKKTWASNEHLGAGLAKLATNGRIGLWEHWGDHKGPENWIQVDLGKEETIERLRVATFWDNYRYYQYTVEGSTDGENWEMIWDNSDNTTLETAMGSEYVFTAQKVRYLKLNMLYNSANPGLHVNEFSAW